MTVFLVFNLLYCQTSRYAGLTIGICFEESVLLLIASRHTSTDSRVVFCKDVWPLTCCRPVMMIHVCLSHVIERALATRVTRSVHTTPNPDITILPWPRVDLGQRDKLTDDNTVFAASCRRHSSWHCAVFSDFFFRARDFTRSLVQVTVSMFSCIFPVGLADYVNNTFKYL